MLKHWKSLFFLVFFLIFALFAHRRCFKEETFGPLLPIFSFSSEDEVLQMANK